MSRKPAHRAPRSGLLTRSGAAPPGTARLATPRSGRLAKPGEAQPGAAGRASRRAGPRSLRPALRAAAALATVVVLGTFVFPTRTFLDQRAAIAEAQAELDALEEQNRALGDQAAKLAEDAEIERLAREQYNLVKPGEDAYALLPTAGGEVPTLSAPLPKDDPDRRNPVRKLWDALTGLF